MKNMRHGFVLQRLATILAINTVTVAHLYTLHSYVLSMGALILAVIHLALLYEGVPNYQ